jgi:hypothetical protein
VAPGQPRQKKVCKTSHLNGIWGAGHGGECLLSQL